MRTLLQLHPEDAPERRELLLRQRAWLEQRELSLVLAAEHVAASDRELYADAIELPPPDAIGGALEKLRPFARTHRIAGILAQSEWGLPAGSLLGRELALPGPSPEAALACLGKHLTRAALASARVPQPAFTLARTAADVRAFAAAHGFPIVLKALASTMARLVARVDDDAAIEPAVARLLGGLATASDVARLEAFARAARLDVGADPRSTFLCESFVAGTPVECDGFVGDGRARGFGVVEQVLTPPPRFFLEGYLMPADRPDGQRLAIQGTAERAALAVGLDAAGFSVELRADGGFARVIEVNGRVGEDAGLHRLFELACGVDPFQLAVAVALGERPLFAPRPTPRHALAYQSCFEEAIVAAVPSVAELAALGLPAALCVDPGAVLHAPPHPETFPHLAWVLASDPASSRAAHARARDLVGRLRFTLVQSPPP